MASYTFNQLVSSLTLPQPYNLKSLARPIFSLVGPSIFHNGTLADNWNSLRFKYDFVMKDLSFDQAVDNFAAYALTYAQELHENNKVKCVQLTFHKYDFGHNEDYSSEINVWTLKAKQYNPDSIEAMMKQGQGTFRNQLKNLSAQIKEKNQRLFLTFMVMGD